MFKNVIFISYGQNTVIFHKMPSEYKPPTFILCVEGLSVSVLPQIRLQLYKVSLKTAMWRHRNENIGGEVGKKTPKTEMDNPLFLWHFVKLR